MSTSSQFEWREVVEKADDDDRHVNNLYPVVYIFNGRKFRDSGPESGVYEK